MTKRGKKISVEKQNLQMQQKSWAVMGQVFCMCCDIIKTFKERLERKQKVPEALCDLGVVISQVESRKERVAGRGAK